MWFWTPFLVTSLGQSGDLLLLVVLCLSLCVVRHASFVNNVTLLTLFCTPQGKLAQYELYACRKKKRIPNGLLNPIRAIDPKQFKACNSLLTNVYNVQPMELLNKLCEIPQNLASPTPFMNKSFSNIKYQTIKGGDNCQRCFQ